MNRELPPKQETLQEKIQKQFEQSRRMTESTLGITLTQIELVGLHNIVKDIMERKEEEKGAYKDWGRDLELLSKKSFFSIPVEREIFETFLLNFYSIQPGDFWTLFYNEDEGPAGHTKEYFRRRQEELHHL